jgi:hypothetical protein
VEKNGSDGENTRNIKSEGTPSFYGILRTTRMKASQPTTFRIAAWVTCALAAAATIALFMKWSGQLRREKQAWFVCTRVNMDIIADAVSSYLRTNTPTPSSAQVGIENLVSAHNLPEWSEIYICPGWVGIQSPIQVYGSSFRSNLFSPSPLAAHFSNCAYYLESVSGKYRVRCRYHTNVLDYTANR